MPSEPSVPSPVRQLLAVFPAPVQTLARSARAFVLAALPDAVEIPDAAAAGATGAIREPVRASRRSKPALFAIVAVVLFAAFAYLFADNFGISKHPTPAPTAFPPPHSNAL